LAIAIGEIFIVANLIISSQPGKDGFPSFLADHVRIFWRCWPPKQPRQFIAWHSQSAAEFEFRRRRHACTGH